jgi:uncharacterized protein
MKIERDIANQIIEKLNSSDKVVIVYGPRQSGKTTLCKDLIERLHLSTLYINAEEQQYRSVLSSRDGDRLTRLIAGYELLVIDEAQRVPDIGINIKILIDRNLPIKIIATGSSSFDLANKVQEPLTGRHWTYYLYPIAVRELSHEYNTFELDRKIEELLVWGMYPEILNIEGDANRRMYMRALMADYLYKDILAFQGLRHPDKLHDLLRLLSFQVGNLVSVSELASSLTISRETVERYLDLLEKTYVIYKLRGFSRNLRKEVTKTAKYYFYDIGVRNGVIDNFNALEQRNDIGALWENFLITERIKKNAYTQGPILRYFWRTHTKAEIDYVETEADDIHGYEFTWSERTKKKPPPSWRDAYPKATWKKIDRANWLDFVL